MTSWMGQKRWKESWGSGRRHSLEVALAARAHPPPGSEVSSATDYSLERSATRDASFLLREPSSVSSQLDTVGYQDKLQGWSAVLPGGTVLAPRPGTSLNSTRPPVHQPGDTDRDVSFLRSNRALAFPAKPRELYDPLDGLVPGVQAVSQRKYYVLPSIGSPSDLLLRRQHSNVETLNQLDYARDNLEDEADFFAELVELKRVRRKSDTPLPSQAAGANPLPPIQKLKDVVRPRTNIAELDEDRLAPSCHSSLSSLSDVEEFRGHTPDPDYADTSPRKGGCPSRAHRTDALQLVMSQTFVVNEGDSAEEDTPLPTVRNYSDR